MWILISTFFLIATLGDQAHSTLIRENERRRFDEIGTCSRGRTAFDMRQVNFSNDRYIDVEGRMGKIRLSIDGENVLVTPIDRTLNLSSYYIDIDSRIDSRRDLDIELEFARLEGRPVIYWKETFENRPYRQGLFTVSGETLLRLCEGRGGRRVER